MELLARAAEKGKHGFKSPFPLGETGPMPLDVLRLATAPMTVRDIVRTMLTRIDITELSAICWTSRRTRWDSISRRIVAGSSNQIALGRPSG